MSRNRKAAPATASDAERNAGLALERDPAGTIDLFFTEPERLKHVGDPIWQDVSTLAVAGRTIFCTCDETATIERVLLHPKSGKAARHSSFALGEVFDLPGGPDGEMDIEGLAISDGYLWVCGSHSLKRDEPDDDALRDLRDVDWDPNRGFLGRVPLIDRGKGIFALAGRGGPKSGEKGRSARMLPMTSSPKPPIRKMLAKDPLIGRFVKIPCKENGLDIEGLAVRGTTVLLGLRGPVVGGLALIVSMELKETKAGRLKPQKLDSGARYRLQALDLNGQAVRDLSWQGGRLLILSGATTDLEALQSVYAIEDYRADRQLYPADAMRRVLDLPVVRGSDHAEGMAVIEAGGAPRLVIAYDAPRDERTDAKAHRLTVDLFELAPDTTG